MRTCTTIIFIVSETQKPVLYGATGGKGCKALSPCLREMVSESILQPLTCANFLKGLGGRGRGLVSSPDFIGRIYRFQYNVRKTRDTESNPRWGWFWVWDRD